MAPVAGRVADREQDRPVLARAPGASASSPHGYQSTGLSRCWSRYGLVSCARRLAIGSHYPGAGRLTIWRPGSPKLGRTRANSAPSVRRSRPIRSTFRQWQTSDCPRRASRRRSRSEKLAEDDREVVLDGLERAEKTEAELRYLADHDSLTGLLDRRRFRAELDQYVSFTARYGGQGAVMIIDIDGLKAVNDTLGHHAGDNLIRQIAAILRERVRATDIVARLSGDEFAVLMPQTDTAGALQLGEDLRAQVAESVPAGSELERGDDQRRDHDVRRRARRSAPRRSWSPPTRRCTGPRRGVATRSPSSSDPSEPRARPGAPPDDRGADPRRAHRRPPQPPHPADPQPRLGRDRALRAAAADDRRGAASCCPPPSFIEAAERSGMVQELDRWVVARALELLAERERQGAPLSLHVNLSGASLTDVSVLEFIERRLDEGGADPVPLHLRDHRDGARLRLRASRRLRRPPHRVRLPGGDRRLRRRLRALPLPEADPLRPDQDRRLLRPRHAAQRRRPAHRQAIVQIARGLGKTTIAEYVQDDTTTQMLREYGVDMAQGFHLGRPVASTRRFAGLGA